MENILYSFTKNGIKCDTRTILENVTDYFTVRELSESDIDKILRKNKNHNRRTNQIFLSKR